MSDKRGFITAWLCAGFMAIVCAGLVIAATAVVAQAAPYQAETVSIGVNPAFNEMSIGSAGNFPMSLVTDGNRRTFLVHVPAKYKLDDAHKLPVVIMLHAGGSDGASAERQTGWDRKADEESFIAVFPDALPISPAKPMSVQRNPRIWNDGSERSRQRNVDDIGFLGAMLDALAQRYPIDTNRVYVTGFAGGGSMAFRVANSVLANRIAAVAPVSGYLYSGGTAAPPRPVPLLFIVGTKDPINPLNGGLVDRLDGQGKEIRPRIADTVAAWAKLDGCTRRPVLISDKDGVRRLAYGPGNDGVEFLFWTVDGMGHQWPGSDTDKRPRSVVGNPTDKLSTDSIWKFLSRHTLALRAEAP